MPVSRYLCIFINVGLGEAAKRDVGTGSGQIPDMGAFASGSGWFRLPGGYIV
ncbi:phage tail protein, partial [Escherichia coli]|nr:phage tail protein [Escherichia coli]